MTTSRATQRFELSTAIAAKHKPAAVGSMLAKR
jgi:hypothetical protein